MMNRRIERILLLIKRDENKVDLIKLIEMDRTNPLMRLEGIWTGPLDNEFLEFFKRTFNLEDFGK